MSVSSIAFHLTDRCQLSCQHCLRDPRREPKDLPVELVDRVLGEAAQFYRTTHVALTGGEPTLHPRFAEVLDAIVARGLTWHLVTNGKRFPSLLALLDEVPARRETLTAVDLSLDGADEATHDAIRAPGSFREVMGAASACTARRIPYVLQMTVHAQNKDQVESMALLASHLGAARVSFAMMQATGSEQDARLNLSFREWRSVQDRIARLQSAMTIPVTIPEGFHRDQPFHVCDALRSEQLHVDVEGRLTLCCQLSGVPGDGADADVAANLATTPLLQAHRRLLQIGHEAQLHRLEAIGAGGLEAADYFPCNWCMRRFGKPHWTAEGSAGPSARRARGKPKAKGRGHNGR